jgi:hypothetical protein
LKAGSKRSRVEVVAIGIAAANRQHAGAQDIRNRVRDVRGIAMVGNKSGKRISNCAPAIGQCEQQHAAIRGKSATIWPWPRTSGARLGPSRQSFLHRALRVLPLERAGGI